MKHIKLIDNRPIKLTMRWKQYVPALGEDEDFPCELDWLTTTRTLYIVFEEPTAIPTIQEEMDDENETIVRTAGDTFALKVRRLAEDEAKLFHIHSYKRDKIRYKRKKMEQ